MPVSPTIYRLPPLHLSHFLIQSSLAHGYPEHLSSRLISLLHCCHLWPDRPSATQHHKHHQPHSTTFLTFFLSNCFTVISQPCSTIMLTMSTISSKGGGDKAPEEEKLNIPTFVRITNTSGFAIPVSVLNRARTALSHQFVNRNEAVVSNVDNNFLAFLWNHVLRIAPVSPVTVGTMTSYANTVYDINIGHNFTTCIIPEVFWQQTGYQTTRLEKKLGEIESFIDLRIWVEVSYSCAKTRNLFTNNHRVMRIQVFLQATGSRLQTPPFPISTLALHLAKPYGARTFFTRE